MRIRAAALAGLVVLAACEISRTPNGDTKKPGSVKEAAQQMAKGASYLFVQEGTRGAFRPAKDSSPAAIVLWGGKGLTTWFTDRPARDAGVMPTSLLVAGWSRGNNSFKADPPNAALVIRDSSGESQVYAMEILTPAYEPTSQTLAYEVRALSSGVPITGGGKAAHQLSDVPARFGSAVLFIDPSESWCMFAYRESCLEALCDPTKPLIFNKAQCDAEQYPIDSTKPPPPLGPQCTDGSLAHGSSGNWQCTPPSKVLICPEGEAPYPFSWQPPLWICNSTFARTAPSWAGVKKR